MAPPTSTYRLQVRASFDLDQVAAACGYLRDLGAGAVYLSPLLPSVAGSDHGYDVVAFDRIDPQRGGEQGWRHALAAAREAQLGVVVDIVPNHTGIQDPQQNAAWADVLANGRNSPYASWFDIEWDADAEGNASKHMHYRRFFAVDSLAGLRVEDEAVFEATHAEILRWVREDGIDGLRIDHPDGLADPLRYLERLRERVGEQCWIIIEKILEPDESLPAGWPVAGTTGYDALAEVTAVFVDPAGEAPLTTAYRELTGDGRSFAEHSAIGKREVATTILRPEVERLHRLDPSKPVEQIVDSLVALDHYRDYEQDGSEYTRFFQQVSGAVMAKGVEDTAYYRYNRFIALNEVGGNPAQFGIDLDRWHDLQRSHVDRAMTALSTHDTKRGEDVRARLAVLAEVPDEWTALTRQLMSTAPLPDTGFAYLLWQTFVGAGFVEPRERMHGYAEKAMREASLSTTWIDPDAEFESLVHAAIDRAYDDPEIHKPLAAFIARITPHGWSNALAQKLVQLTMPGVPDVYQGTELWDDSLVDPDNRRPVDFAVRADRVVALDSVGEPPPVDASGDAKLWITSHALRLRRNQPKLFTGYAAIAGEGPAAEHALAFARSGAITVATRLPVGLKRRGGWGATSITLDGAYTEVLTGTEHTGSVLLADLLATYPVALLAPAAVT